jgi:hypothetical protein
VHPSQLKEYFGNAIWYRRYRTGHSDLAAFQMFWPGKIQGLYPWQPGCDSIVVERQPLLYTARDSANA